MRKALLLAACFAMSTLTLPSVHADEETLATGYCARMERNINLIVDYTSTTCVPFKDGDGEMSSIFVSWEPAFLSEASKKAWFLVVVTVFGGEFNAHSERTSHIIVSDVYLMRQAVPQAYQISSDVARQLQQQVKSNQIDLETMYQRASEAMSPVSMPKSAQLSEKIVLGKRWGKANGKSVVVRRKASAGNGFLPRH